MEFREKEGYKPEVKLEYVDEAGRTMTPKEAFRYLSHRFHGKGSGKKKLEKRIKKAEEDHVRNNVLHMLLLIFYYWPGPVLFARWHLSSSVTLHGVAT